MNHWMEDSMPGVLEGEPPKAATRNACKLCTPLGAAMVFKGIRGCLPFLHGSQGCATYIRRYMISHFREPVDIASSSFSEDDAIFGGARNFAVGVDNVVEQYRPELIGVATTCLSETIGENMLGMIRDYQERHAGEGPPLVHVSTAAYSGTHVDGFHAAVREVVAQFARPGHAVGGGAVNLLPSMMSCADLRELRGLVGAYGLHAVMLPDYSDTLEGASWDDYRRIAPGGTPVDAVRGMADARCTIEIGRALEGRGDTAGAHLEREYGVPRRVAGWPMGVRATDRFHALLEEVSGTPAARDFGAVRGRVVDAYIDAHKYTAGRRAALFGEPDLVLALAGFLSEFGVRPVLCATGAKIKGWRAMLEAEVEGGCDDVVALAGADHAAIGGRCRELAPDLLVGSSKGYPIARELGVPLVRIGFPVHDRVGAQRMLTVGYEGTLAMFDRIVNQLLEVKQEESTTGYSYI